MPLWLHSGEVDGWAAKNQIITRGWESRVGVPARLDDEIEPVTPERQLPPCCSVVVERLLEVSVCCVEGVATAICTEAKVVRSEFIGGAPCILQPAAERPVAGQDIPLRLCAAKRR